MKTVHLVYPHGSSISCPDAIGRNVASYLDRHGYGVKLYDWDDPGVIDPAEGDILVGHPHPSPATIFRRSLQRSKWGRRIGMFPFAPGDPVQNAFEDSIVRQCDVVLAITGNFWIDQVGYTPFAHWQPKLHQVDLAVDRSDFPPLKRAFNPKGERRFLYIGHDAWYKNTDYLSQIAQRSGSTEFGWIGKSLIGRPIQGTVPLGRRNFSEAASQELLSGFDFMITVGKADANPTTILESMAWGLVPVCTKQSGYAGYDSIPTVPVDDADRAAELIANLQHLPEEDLLAMQATNWQLLDSHFNWERFGRQVLDAIESDASPALGYHGLGQKARLRLNALRSPYSPLRSSGLRMWLRQYWRTLRMP